MLWFDLSGLLGVGTLITVLLWLLWSYISKIMQADITGSNGLVCLVWCLTLCIFVSRTVNCHHLFIWLCLLLSSSHVLQATSLTMLQRLQSHFILNLQISSQYTKWQTSRKAWCIHQPSYCICVLGWHIRISTAQWRKQWIIQSQRQLEKSWCSCKMRPWAKVFRISWMHPISPLLMTRE